jgi:hypothetical protein
MSLASLSPATLPLPKAPKTSALVEWCLRIVDCKLHEKREYLMLLHTSMLAQPRVLLSPAIRRHRTVPANSMARSHVLQLARDRLIQKAKQESLLHP